MDARRFFRYELRTTHTDAARAFYADVLGPEFWGTDVTLAPLPERAAAMGAPAHWLGHVGVEDVASIADRIVGLGGQPLGPPAGSGSTSAVLRDPFGAIVAVSAEPSSRARDVVAYHLLHAHDHERAFAVYAGLFGWAGTGAADLGAGLGTHQMFAWDASGRNAGSIANTARLPHVHVHWLFHFLVADMEASLARVRSGGGTIAASVRSPGGDLVAACDDPQGAAFGLYQIAI